MALVTMNAGPRGISPRGQDLTGFELAGEDGVWYPATARVSKVYNLKVTSEHVPAPVKVRYCMHDWSVGTVFNGFGIPALPFTTDN
jgi:sialate O-acetylesterase